MSESAAQKKLTGIWKETAVLSSICGGSYTALSSVTAELRQSGSELSGSVTFLDLYDDTKVVGTLQAEIDRGQVKGEINLQDRYGNDRTYEVALEQKGDALQGTFTDSYEQECSFFGPTDTWVMDVTLLRKLTEVVKPDGEEPNNTARQATTINVGESLELSLGKGDVDWFTFDVAEASMVTFDFELLTALDASVWVLQEGEMPTENILKAALKLEKSELETQTNQRTLQLQLAPGKHYIVVTGSADETALGSHEENGKYTLNFLACEVLPDAAFEPNDTPEQATPLTEPSATFYYAYEDVDWYTFTLEQSEIIKLEIAPSGTSYLHNALFDQTMVEVSNFNFGNNVEIALQPGQYFLKIASDALEANTYTINLSRQLVPDNSYEPNNTVEQASVIPENFTGNMYLTKNDTDWFTFTLTESMLVKLTLLEGQYNVSAKLYDANERELVETSWLNFSEVIKAGKYFITFSSPATLEYVFSLSSLPLPDNSIEPNDQKEQATIIDSNYTARDNELFLVKNEEDWFKFTLSETNKTSFKFNGNIHDFIDLNVTLYDTTMTQIFPQIYKSSTFSLTLLSGDYYLKIDGGNNQTYSFSIESTPLPEDSFEPNNDFNQAVRISSGFSASNLKVHALDEDWFIFTLPAPARVNLNVVGDYNKLYNRFYDSSLVPFPYGGTLAAGTYYIKFFTESEPQDYSFTFSTSAFMEDVYEPNNSLRTASTIDIGFNEELFLVAGDKDWFKFTLSQTKRLKFSEGLRGLTVNGRLRLYQNSELYPITDIYNYEITMTLGPGTYYIAATDSPSLHRVGTPYLLKISE